MHNWLIRSTVVLAILASCAVAETAYRSADGNLYLIRDSAAAGPSFERLTVIDLTENTPDKPDTPVVDKWKLIATSRFASASIDYAGKEEEATRISAYYTGLAMSVEAGTIPRDKLGVAVDAVYKLAAGGKSEQWNSWKEATDKAFNAAPINTAEDAAQGLRDIASGVSGANQAVDWEKLIKFFIEVILPLIITLIGSGA